MTVVLAGNWWAWIIRGVLAILFGILALVFPGATLRVLALLFGAYAVVEGIFNGIIALRAPKGESRWWVLLLEGIISVAAGFIAFLYPDITVLVFVVLLGVWAIITGAFEIAAAIRLRKYIEGEWLLVLSGILSILFGAIFLFVPSIGALTIAVLVGAYALLFGILLVALGIKLRRWGKRARDVS
jgi:uncharacterized membrane protein HdeD (DUF308 family)